jgi:hypothetical protein
LVKRRQESIARDSCTGIEEFLKVDELKSPDTCREESKFGSAAASDTDPCQLERFWPPRMDFFRQSAASIDDASHPCVGMKPNAQIGLAWNKAEKGGSGELSMIPPQGNDP